MIKKELLDILVCPESKQELSIAPQKTIDNINEKIKQKKIKNRNGDILQETIQAGLIREDKKYLYPIKDDIPIMLIEEAILITNE